MKKLLVLGVGLLLGACGRQASVPEDHFYRLPALLPATILNSPVVNESVLVRVLESDGVHRERAIVYTEDSRGIRLQQHHYHFWLEPPPRLLQRRFARYLRAIGFSPIVLTEGGGASQGMVITGRILRFERELAGHSAQAVVGLELQLEQMGSGRRGVPLLLREYEAVIPAGESFSASAVAFGEALSKIFADFVRDARKVLPRRSQASG